MFQGSNLEDKEKDRLQSDDNISDDPLVQVNLKSMHWFIFINKTIINVEKIIV
jgi:hypothetical protein